MSWLMIYLFIGTVLALSSTTKQGRWLLTDPTIAAVVLFLWPVVFAIKLKEWLGK